MDRGVYIGIDGGGTHSTAAAVLPDGRVASVISGGGCNFHADGVEAVRGRVAEMVRALCVRTGRKAKAVCVGMSALDGPADEKTRALFALPGLSPGGLVLDSDAFIALMGLTRGGPGMIAVCGTGSMLLLTDGEGRRQVGGGWGYLLKDPGSAYSIARRALLAVAARSDGIGGPTALTGEALRHFGADTPRGLIERIYAPECTPAVLARFAVPVLRLAAEGEAEAKRILVEEMRAFAAQALGLLRKAPGVKLIGLYGGVFAHSGAARDAFRAAVEAGMAEAVFRDVELPPELGAVLHLMRREGTLTEERIERMKKNLQGDGAMSAINGYFENLKKLLEGILDTQAEAMERAARAIADCLKGGGMVYTFGTGHGHLLALEIFYRAGGMARVCPILDEKLMLHVSAAGSTLEERKEGWVDLLLERYPMKAGDVLISMSNSGRNAVPVLLAKRARERGVYVIALTSLTHSGAVTARNSLGLRLFETADLVLDNGGCLGDASVRFPDGAMVGPTSTACGAAILQAVVCRVKELSLEEGFEADFFQSSNVDGGDEWNDRLIARYGDRIPGLK